MVQKLLLSILFIGISAVIVATSPIWKATKINNLNQLNYIPLGFPLPFIEQRATLTPVYSDLPIYVSLLNPMEGNDINRFFVAIFILDIALLTGFLVLIYALYKLLFGRD